MSNWNDDGTKRKRWRFTLNNWNQEEKISIENWKYVKHITIGEEIAPTTGTPHLQGYVEWTSDRTFNTIKKLNPRISWRPADASAEANIKYCSKDGIVTSKGEPHNNEQGKRNDILAAKEILDNGGSILDIAENNYATFINNHKALEAYQMLRLRARTTKPTITWLWGKAGVGKTKWAVETNESFYIKDSTQWWNGYLQQKVIIIDDFDSKWPYRDLLRLLDRYPYAGQFKGGYVNINSPCIYITCEYPPQHFWSNNELAQVTRRLDSIIEILENGEVRCNTISELSSYPENRERDMLGLPKPEHS